MTAMELTTRDLLLKTLTNDDTAEVSRMWNFEKGSISHEAAQKAIENMQNNHKQNRIGHIHHLCFAVFEQNKSDIIGWCGLDGKCSPGQIEIFYLIDKGCRNKGYATQCAEKLLEYAFEIAEVNCVYGGCFKDNISSYKVLVKAKMILYKTLEDSGNPHFYIDKEIYEKMKHFR